jgi:DNA-directed RNA polymerase subunit M/transcription elongation factor TFIIS
MQFCRECESIMTKNTTPVGSVLFTCKCQLVDEGGPDDTLIDSEYLETAESNIKHQIFIENSPYDAAANIVLKDCPICKLNFLVMLRIGSNETTMYTCSCGFVSTYDEYILLMDKNT